MSHIITISRQYVPCTTNSTACTPTVITFVPVVPPEPIGARQDIADRREAEKLTPPSSVLREMARKYPPPQEWRVRDTHSGHDQARANPGRGVVVGLMRSGGARGRQSRWRVPRPGSTRASRTSRRDHPAPPFPARPEDRRGRATERRCGAVPVQRHRTIQT
jgi:hypothetical protein